MQKLPLDVRALKEWFRGARRVLPWRENPTPYAVWISEVMLQQTQVAVVVDYFLRWMGRFPSIAALAAASVEEVIKQWEGLGYYSRARSLHAAAQFLMQNFGGKLPEAEEELALVKGIGPYTRGAIRSFAFRQKAAAVDGNVIRVLARYFAIEEEVHKSSTVKKLWDIARGILPDEEPWLVTEGLIELGALVCKKDPRCWECPLRQGCLALQRGVQEELPRKGKKLAITPLERTVFVVRYRDEFLVKKGEKGGVMADLYEFPFVEKIQAEFPFAFAAKEVKALSAVQHSFTRYRVKLYPVLWQALEKGETGGYHWLSQQQMQQVPFSSGHRRVLKEVENALFTH